MDPKQLIVWSRSVQWIYPFYGSRSFVTLFTEGLHWDLSPWWALSPWWTLSPWWQHQLFVTENSASASLSSSRPCVEIFGADNYSAVTASPHLRCSIFIPLWSLRPPCVNPRYPVWHPESSGLIQLMKANTSLGARGVGVQNAENMSDASDTSPAHHTITSKSA